MTATGEGPRVLVLQHLACEHPGSLRDPLLRAGMSMHAVELDEGEAIPDLVDFDLMLVMGGPMNVWEEDRYPWLITEKAAIRFWVEVLGRPYLGVCLGHQLLADALGGAVGLMATTEIGVRPVQLHRAAQLDPLFGVLPPTVSGLQWHGAEVRRVPQGATVLASNAACAVQAFRAAPLAWGVQFHLEVSGATVGQWACVPGYYQDLEATGVMDAPTLEREVNDELENMRRATAALATRLVATVNSHAVAHRSELGLA